MAEEQLNPKYLNRIKQFRLLDDTFFAVCFANDIQLTEFVLRILLDKEDLDVIDTRTQYTMKNLLGHSVTFDVYAADSSGRKYDIEVQRDNRGAIPKRARYHSSLIDGRILEKGEPYQKLPETYVIFITEKDFWEDGLPVYHIERTVMETGKPFGDEAHIIYVNASYATKLPPEDMDALTKLLHDFNCSDPNKMYYSLVAQKVQHFKEDEQEVKHMCQIMEELYEEARQDAFAEAEAKFAEERVAVERAAKAEAEEIAKEKAMKSAIRMIKDGLKVEKISEYTSLPVDKVQELADLIAG